MQILIQRVQLPGPVIFKEFFFMSQSIRERFIGRLIRFLFTRLFRWIGGRVLGGFNALRWRIDQNSISDS